jgi:hypothetical protein
MSDADQLAAIGQKLTAALTSAYTSSDPNAALVFLPGGVSVPADLLQSGTINPAQMETFLETNFDSPFVISPSEGAVHGKDESHGSSSEIYMIAATSAQPLGSPTDGSWKRVAAEIAVAQSGLTAANMQGGFVCEPDDWILPANTGYWSTFDSTQVQPAPTAPAPTATATAAPAPVPIVNPRIWMIRTLPIAAMPVVHPPAPQMSVLRRPMPAAAPARFIRRSVLNASLVAQPPPTSPPAAAPPPAPPAPSSTITVQLQHQCVTLGYMTGGVSWWDGAFLADAGWYIPGMTRGALLPIPQATALNPDLAYGIPVALIVVQGLTVTGNWTGETAASLGSVGPFSLQGATATSGNDGAVTFSRPGMQVIALLCSQLPILPPADAPEPTVTTPPATTPLTPTTPAATPPVETTPAATPSTATPSPAAPTDSTPTAPAAAPAPAPAASPSTATNGNAASPPASTPKTTT